MSYVLTFAGGIAVGFIWGCIACRRAVLAAHDRAMAAMFGGLRGPNG